MAGNTLYPDIVQVIAGRGPKGAKGDPGGLDDAATAVLISTATSVASDTASGVVATKVDQTAFDAAGAATTAALATKADLTLLSPPLLRQGAKAVQKSIALLKRTSGVEGVGGEYFPGSTKSPQGFASVQAPGGPILVVDKQRVNDDVVNHQYFQLMVYEYQDVGLGFLEPLYFTANTLDLGHHQINGYYDTARASIQMWSPDGTDGGAADTRGLIRFKLDGAANTTADYATVTEDRATRYRMLKPAGTNHWSSKYYGTGGCTDDGKYVWMRCSAFGAPPDSTNSHKLMFIWDRLAVEAAGVRTGGVVDATDVQPIASYPIAQPADQAALEIQDQFSPDSRFLYSATGSTAPHGAHYIIVQELLTGQLVEMFRIDSARGNYTLSQMMTGGLLLSGGGEIGVCGSMEPEGCFGIPPASPNSVPNIVVQEKWQDITGASIVTWQGFNWICGTTGLTTEPGVNQSWRPTWRAATAGTWDPTKTDYVGTGGNTRIRCNVVALKAAEGLAGERPLDSGIINRLPASGDLVVNNYFNWLKQSGTNYRWGTICETSQTYKSDMVLIDGSLLVRDSSTRSLDDGNNFGNFVVTGRMTSDGIRRSVSLTHSNATYLQAFAVDDALFPRRVTLGRVNGSIYPFQWTIAAGAVFEKVGGGTISLETLNNSVGSLSTSYTTATANVTTEYRVAGTRVVGARVTGFSADTGTAEKTAKATYTAGSAIASPTSDTVGTKAAIDALIARVAALETSEQNWTRKDKATNDALRAHGITD